MKPIEDLLPSSVKEDKGVLSCIIMSLRAEIERLKQENVCLRNDVMHAWYARRVFVDIKEPPLESFPIDAQKGEQP